MEDKTKTEGKMKTQTGQEPSLFSLLRKKGHYWDFIKLVAPRSSEHRWESGDAIAAWCGRCQVQIAYSVANIKSFKSHSLSKHPDHYGQDVKRPPKKAILKQKITDAVCSLPKRRWSLQWRVMWRKLKIFSALVGNFITTLLPCRRS